MRSASFIRAGVSPFSTAAGSSPLSILSIRCARLSGSAVCRTLFLRSVSLVVCPSEEGGQTIKISVISADEGHTTPFCNRSVRLIAASRIELLPAYSKRSGIVFFDLGLHSRRLVRFRYLGVRASFRVLV